jgi:hypothetical protein
MELAKGAAEDNNNEIPSTKGIWRSTQHKDISRNICVFMWMNLHSGYKVGEHWRYIVAEPDGRSVEIVHTDGWTATPSAALFSAFLFLAASSGANTRVTLILFILRIFLGY